jgi:hypothetical protein
LTGLKFGQLLSIMKTTVIAGIVLMIAGVIAVASGRTADTDRERLLRASGESRRVFLPVLGAVAVAAGAGLVILGSKRG